MLLSKLSKIGKKDQPSDLPKYAEQLEHTVEDVRRLAADLNKGLQQHVLFSKRNVSCAVSGAIMRSNPACVKLHHP
ncbi:hypothetical protein P879_02203 [Paragonimus westermani]|uniref:Uncharacterized protein n=1 Tax=Paragonimus westermani TaxID=34504 RepID=A0A8T0DW48_9TREM|nr:hypothetical protein P879_02203 [Paragonimus westermani]